MRANTRSRIRRSDFQKQRIHRFGFLQNKLLQTPNLAQTTQPTHLEEVKRVLKIERMSYIGR